MFKCMCKSKFCEHTAKYGQLLGDDGGAWLIKLIRTSNTRAELIDSAMEYIIWRDVLSKRTNNLIYRDVIDFCDRDDINC